MSRGAESELAGRHGVRRKLARRPGAVRIPAHGVGTHQRKLGKGWPEHNPIARNAPAISPRAAEKTFALLLLLLRFSAHETSPAAPDNGRKAPPRLAKPHHVCALSQAQSRPGVAHVRRLRARREPAADRRSYAAPAEARRRLQARQRGLDALGRRLTGLSRGKTNPAKQPLGQPIGSICPVLSATCSPKVGADLAWWQAMARPSIACQRSDVATLGRRRRRGEKVEDRRSSDAFE